MYVIIGSLGIIAAAMVGLTFLIKKRKILRRSVGKAPCKFYLNLCILYACLLSLY